MTKPYALTCKLGFECVTCSRCGGTGNYSWNAINGTRCFKCRGAKIARTKRGAAAANVYAESLKVPAGSLVVGDTMQCEDYLAGKRWFAPIVSIVATERDGKVVLDITTDHPKAGKSGLVTWPEYLVRKGWLTVDKTAKLQLALDYQDTLTTAGTPRKRSA